MESKDFRNKFQIIFKTEFKRIDELIAKFQNQFIQEQLPVLKQDLPALFSDEELHQLLKNYASQVFNCTDSVLDKDNNFCETRLNDELGRMKRNVKKRYTHNSLSELADKSHRIAKKIVVHHFPAIFELSANGFRLLEKYAFMYNQEFFLYLENQIRNFEEKQL